MNNDNEKYLKKILELEDEIIYLHRIIDKAENKLFWLVLDESSPEYKDITECKNILKGKLTDEEKELITTCRKTILLETRKKILKFENEDLIITDPCYIMNENNKDDWHKCEYGYNMEVLGFDPDSYVTSSTIYGDWSCSVFNTDTKEKIGGFCADAGLVSVFRLKDVLKYNPDFDLHDNETWSTTWIKNFTGEVRINYDVDECGEIYCFVEGEGSVNFISRQTGF